MNFLSYKGLIRTVKAITFIRLSVLPFIKKPNIQCAFISCYLDNIVFGYNQNKLVYKCFSYRLLPDRFVIYQARLRIK